MVELAESMLGNCAIAGLIAVGAVLASRLRASPALVHGLWLLAVVKLVTPPLWRVELVAAPAEVESSAAPMAGPGELEVAAWLEFAAQVSIAALPPVPVSALPESEPAAEAVRWDAVVLGVWLCGAALALGSALLRALRVGRTIRRAPLAPTDLAQRAHEIATRIGLHRVPEVRVVPERLSPMIFAWLGRPRLALPAALLARLDRGSVDALLAHELAHVRRGDHRVRLLELMVRALYWWNPLAWWVCRRLRRAEDDCCDAWVVWALPDGRRPYAEALVDAAEFLNESRASLPAVACGIGSAADLTRRVTMIMKATPRRSLTRTGRLTMLVLCAFALPLAPTGAQERTDELHRKLERHHAESSELESAIREHQHRLEELRAHGRRDEARAVREQLADLEAALEAHAATVAEIEHELHTAGHGGEHEHGAEHGAAHAPDFVIDKRVMKSLKAAIKALRKQGQEDHANVIEHVLHRVAHEAKPEHRDVARRDAFVARDAARLEAERARIAAMHAELEAKRAELELKHSELSTALDPRQAKRKRDEPQRDERLREMAELHDRMIEMQHANQRQVELLQRQVAELANAVQELRKVAKPPRSDR